MKLEQIKGQRVAILGYGREGRAAHALLRDRFPDQLIAIFTGTEPLPMQAHSGNDRFHEGLPTAAQWPSIDVAVRSPGISPYCGALEAGAEHGVQTTSGTAIWFAEHPQATTVAITGTKGKSTTASLSAHLLREAGSRVVLAGNVGVPLLEVMRPEPEPEIWVMELSSFQIHGLVQRPNFAVGLSLFPEHLDWHGNEARYYADKLSLFNGLGRGAAIVNHADENLMAHLPPLNEPVYFNHDEGIHVRGNRVFDGDSPLFDLEHFALPGVHNRSNLCAALTVLKCLDVDPSVAVSAVESFHALPHRLQSLGERSSVEYIDDSIATTPRATQAALECFPTQELTLLLGGFDRGQDWRELTAFVQARPVQTVIAFGAVASKVVTAFGSCSATQLLVARTLADAVRLAAKHTPAQGVVLLSPGAPSFDEFRNYEARGEAFAHAAGISAG